MKKTTKTKKLILDRIKIRELGAVGSLSPEEMQRAAGAKPPAPTQRHSCFDSCYNTDCCLIVP
jgi:hypothetical protein